MIEGDGRVEGHLTCDGSVLLGRTGPAGIGFVLELSTGNQIRSGVPFDIVMTATAAERLAIIMGLDVALAEGVEIIRVVTDDETLVAQMNGKAGARARYGRALVARARELAARFEHFEIRAGDDAEVFESHTLARRAAKDAFRMELKPGANWREDLILSYGLEAPYP